MSNKSGSNAVSNHSIWFTVSATHKKNRGVMTWVRNDNIRRPKLVFVSKPAVVAVDSFAGF